VLFPFVDYWWFYLIFTAFVAFVLAIDLGVFHRKAEAISFKQATIWSVVWIALALTFNFGLYQYILWKAEQGGIPGADGPALAKQLGLEFLTGFLIEKSLSVDNLFVFIAVFAFFGIPEKYQHRILFYGIIGALIFRAIFIALGSVLMQYESVVLFFGGLLIITGIKLFFAPKKAIDPSKNFLLKGLKRVLPVTSEISDHHFIVKKDGLWHATPLLLALIFIEFSDIIFAVDSVPAIFALTKEPMIVFTSNVFALLGLRSLYFLLAGVYHRFHLLKYALGIVLIFVGLKMVWLNHLFNGKFPVSWSLSFIALTLLASIALSLRYPQTQQGLPN
jgi:tellurite resistance protein TerC